MRSLSFVACLILIAAPFQSAVGAENPSEALELPKDTINLPKVASRAAILKNGPADQTVISEWVRAFIEAKEKKANAELEVLKKKALAEDDARIAAEKDRVRRQEKYDQSWGSVGAKATNRGRAALRMKLEFQVLEIDSYRAISESQRYLSTLANDIAQDLSLLDRDGDGKLSGDEYRDAGAVLASTKRLFQALDVNADGMITEDELDSSRKVPRSTSAAARAGRDAASVAGYKIKPYDADGNGILDVDERKAMAMAFVDLSVRLAQDADFYKSLMENLSKAREIVAAKFANIEVNP